MTSLRPSRRLAPAIGLALLLAAFAAHAAHLAVVAEDAYITFRYARHLAAGAGFVWNLGEPAVEGFTSPLWLLLLAAASRLGLDLVWTAQLLGVAAAAAGIVLTVVCARRLLALPRWAAAAAGALVAASGPYATWAASGMETSAFALAVLAATACGASYLRRGAAGALSGGASAAVAALLLRPEGAAVALLLAAGLVLLAPPRAGRIGAVAARFLLPCLLAAVALTAWRFAIFGDWLPNTYYAKTGGGWEQWRRGFEYVRYFALFFVTPLAPAWVAAGWTMARGRRGAAEPAAASAARREHRATHLLFALVPLGLAAVVVLEGGDYMAMFRFLVPAVPPLALLAASALSRAADGSPTVARAAVSGGALALALAGTVVHSTPLEAALFEVPPRQHGNYRGVLAERWHTARLRAVAKFFETMRRSPDDVLATRAIGVIGFLWGGKVDDLAGLTDRHIARRQVASMGRGWAGHEKMDLDHSFRRLPRFVELDRELAPVRLDEVAADLSGASLVATLGAAQAHYPRARRFLRWMRRNPEFLARHYRLRTAWIDDRDNRESGWFVYLERRDADAASSAAARARSPAARAASP